MHQVVAEEPSPCDEVPDEVLLQVFSHLQPWDVLLGVAGVCRRWRMLSQDRSLWQRALLDAGACKHEDVILVILTTAPTLRTVAFKDPYAAVSVTMLKTVLSLPTPLSGFHFLAMEYDADMVLAIIGKLAPHLEELSLRVHRRLAASPLVAMLAAMPRLESLRLLGPVRPEAGQECPAGSWPRLRRLDVRQAILDRVDFLHQILCGTSESLETLLLPRYLVLPEAVQAQLCACKRLSSLAPARLEDLVVVDALPQLSELLVEADLFEPARHGFLADVRGLARVRALSLRIGDEDGAVFLAAACPATRRLTLRGTLAPWAIDIAKGTPAVLSLRVVEPAVRLRLGTADPLASRMAVLEEVCRALPRLREFDLRRCFQGRVPPGVDELLRNSNSALSVILPITPTEQLD